MRLPANSVIDDKVEKLVELGQPNQLTEREE